ncbi:capsular polysaccharide export protein, LipB/KpsS family [Selenomonas sputigena]|jgi:hypothetical protein|uniref:Capsule polysaccharide biosynthesis protein n=2 Tax=Selenomonas sputigena (strain ATCC 35185 / DSM 20758 / CCUG 44933 / VPI D19B-28) TaxID=546271 RepID=F4EWQ5_SELS3|nr:hypothetical protein [Selenomonas sputigena]AEB99031.1 hypothetical protein Selsp_0048 [Selenomonas sputigena ATCC 35185]
MIERIGRFIKRNLKKRFCKPVSVGEMEFASLNAPFWQDEKIASTVEKRILVYVAGDYITPVVETMLFAKRLSKEREMPLDVLGGSDILYKPVRSVYQSFHIRSVLDAEMGWLEKAKVLYEAILAWRMWREGNDILAMTYDGIPIGEELYDAILSHNREQYTVDKIELKHIYDAYLFYKNIHIAKRIFHSQRYGVFIFSDGDYINSPFVKFAAKYGAEIYQTSVGRVLFHKIIKDFTLKYSSQITHQMYEECRAMVPRRIIDQYLTERFRGEAKADYDRQAFFGKKEYSKEDLCKFSGLSFDSDCKFVVVAAHAFSDRPHSGDIMVYRDYYQWLIETLKLLDKVEGVVVFVKEHPSALLYGEKGSISHLVRQYGWKQIYTLPEDFHTYSIFRYFDYVVTCKGTIGLEAASFGIPVFTAGQGYYYGFGVDINSTTTAEYEQRLQNIKRYERLPETVQERARILLYLMGQITPPYAPSVIPADRFRSEIAQLRSEEYQYTYINQRLREGKSIKDEYYERILKDIIVFDETVGTIYEDLS